ncbi:pantetheine-phosphate adenylyltransferase [[Eubacterium] yurii subsp. margaretiae ATCC 43715]|nr:pantetheine-phosphate adenylyltransferase [[Eubacterium] yurii subsp. margaretiae ATCC 43715]
MKLTAVYPGSFDPITNGHLDIIKRASNMYDTLVVAILINKEKKPLFSLEERVEMIKEATKGMDNIKVDHFSGLFVDYCMKKDINVSIRGLRAMSDFEIELQMAHINDVLSKSTLETVFLATSTQYSYLSSSVVKEIAMFNGDYSSLVPKNVCERLGTKFKQK